MEGDDDEDAMQALDELRILQMIGQGFPEERVHTQRNRRKLNILWQAAVAANTLTKALSKRLGRPNFFTKSSCHPTTVSNFSRSAIQVLQWLATRHSSQRVDLRIERRIRGSEAVRRFVFTRLQADGLDPSGSWLRERQQKYSRTGQEHTI